MTVAMNTLYHKLYLPLGCFQKSSPPSTARFPTEGIQAHRRIQSCSWLTVWVEISTLPVTTGGALPISLGFSFLSAKGWYLQHLLHMSLGGLEELI